MGVKSGEPGRGTDGRKSRWSAHRAARREEFIDAALRALAEHGPELHIGHVAQQAGVSKPVLYRQFADKADLLAALQERGVTMLIERVVPALDDSLPPLDRIRGAIDGFFSLLDEHPNLYWLAARTIPTGPRGEGTGVHAGKALTSAELTRIFDESLHFFGLDTRGAEPWAHAIVGMVQNTAEWWLEKQSMSRREVVDRLTEMVWAALDGFLRGYGITLDPKVPIGPDHVMSATPRHAPWRTAPPATEES
ncbi:TetR/AcrR family transcriptional regulator [Streptomyces sp. NPDC018031]|uniref:TetR/AcrR family transcriptional regulator n=1 Tax=Streptomyces sp. NPDC018031 TaxID=3365033 RepID=UPI00378EF3C5